MGRPLGEESGLDPTWGVGGGRHRARLRLLGAGGRRRPPFHHRRPGRGHRGARVVPPPWPGREAPPRADREPTAVPEPSDPLPDRGTSPRSTPSPCLALCPRSRCSPSRRAPACSWRRRRGRGEPSRGRVEAVVLAGGPPERAGGRRRPRSRPAGRGGRRRRLRAAALLHEFASAGASPVPVELGRLLSSGLDRIQTCVRSASHSWSPHLLEHGSELGCGYPPPTRPCCGPWATILEV